MVRRPIRKLFVEGGARDNDSVRSECQKAFTQLLERAGLAGRMPRIVSCANRRNAYDQFCTAIERCQNGDLAVLLVDSEGPVGPPPTNDTTAKQNSPWKYVATRNDDQWSTPTSATDEHLHLMVECMEAWFFADRGALRSFFGNGFAENRLPVETKGVESISKAALNSTALDPLQRR